MSIISFGFTNKFLNKIEQNNKNHSEAPLALVIQGEYDDNQTIYSQAAFHNILEISKTYEVAIKVIGLKSLWRQTIQETAKKYQKNISLLYVIMHGNPNGLRCGKEEFLKISDFQEDDFFSLTPLATIMLVACKAGLTFAPYLAKITGRTVLACKDEIEPIRTAFAGGVKPPQLLCYNQSNQLITEMFLPNGTSKLLTIHEHLKEELFSDKVKYIKALASQGDPLAEIDLADMLKQGFFVEQSIEQAIQYYKKAANQELMQAQLTLGIFYQLGGKELSQSNELALYWLTKAANQGHPVAQAAIGKLYHQGPPLGIVQSDQTALFWYHKAAQQMNKKAIFNIGIFCEEGRGGLTPSDHDALACYEAAANGGHRKALLMMAIFHETGRGGLTASKEEALRYYHLIPDPEKQELLRKKIEALRFTKLPC